MANTDYKVEKGRVAEADAETWLEFRGFQILRKNWRSLKKWKAGEVDIVARRAPCELWVIEVKCQRGGDFALITPKQITRLRRAAVLLSSEMPGFQLRFGLLWVEPQTKQIQWIENPRY